MAFPGLLALQLHGWRQARSETGDGVGGGRGVQCGVGWGGDGRASRGLLEQCAFHGSLDLKRHW